MSVVTDRSSTPLPLFAGPRSQSGITRLAGLLDVLVVRWTGVGVARRYARDFVVAGLVEIAVYARGVPLCLAVVAASLVVSAKGVALR